MMIQALLLLVVSAAEVRVDIIDAQPGNAKVTKAHRYASQVTLD
jgi:hypothetical protein